MQNSLCSLCTNVVLSSPSSAQWNALFQLVKKRAATEVQIIREREQILHIFSNIIQLKKEVFFYFAKWDACKNKTQFIRKLLHLQQWRDALSKKWKNA